MVSKKLMGVWAFFDFCLLAAGAVTIALSVVWQRPDVLMNMVLSKQHLLGGIILGVAFVVTFFISVFGVIQRNHITIGLVITNYALLLDCLGIIVIGTVVWFYTLQERANFHGEWIGATSATRLALQDKFKCCGYFNGTDLAEIGGNFCVSQDFVNGLDPNALTNFCVQPITNFADMTLNNIFTTVYGFMAFVLCLLLTTLCVIKKRHEDERFKRIDAKRGGKGFV